MHFMVLGVNKFWPFSRSSSFVAQDKMSLSRAQNRHIHGLKYEDSIVLVTINCKLCGNDIVKQKVVS